MSEWISVDDRLPELSGNQPYSVDVLATYDDNIGLAYILWDDCIFDDDGNLDISCDLKTALSRGWGYWEWNDVFNEVNPTHWMPLPNPPKP